MHSQYVYPKHPPDKKYRDDGPRDVNDPVASGFRFPEIEHAEMVAGPRSWRNIPISLIDPGPACQSSMSVKPVNNSLGFR